MEEKFGNYETVIGDVDKREIKEISGEDKLGKLTLSVGNSNSYVDLWNPNKADSNKVKEFFRNIDKGERIQLQGALQEEFYQDDYQRKVRAFVSANKGVTFKKVDKKAKNVAALSGSIMKQDMRYDNLERFDADNVPVLDIRIVIFDLYNRETQEEDLTKKDVILDELENKKEYMKDDEDDVPENQKNTINKLIKKTKNTDDIETLFKILNQYYKLFQPRMFNIDILNLTAYNEIAEELAEESNKYDNISVGVQINNFQNVDQYGFTDGYINEVEIKKIKEINKYEESGDDDDFLDESW